MAGWGLGGASRLDFASRGRGRWGGRQGGGTGPDRMMDG
jgi:hypothetical protein